MKNELKIGDIIQAANAEDLIGTMCELQKTGIQTDFMYERDGKEGLWLEIVGFDAPDCKLFDKSLVEHPSHYNRPGRRECWDEMIGLFGKEATAIYDCLSAYKYIYRAGLKDGNPESQDMAKIKKCMEHARSLIFSDFGENYPKLGKVVYNAMQTIIDDMIDSRV